MVVLIVFVVLIHQICTRLMQKADRWPMRLVFIKVTEFACKIGLIPFVFVVFIATFPNGLSEQTRIGLGILFGFGAVYFLFRESVGFFHSFKDVMVLVRAKVENPSTTQLSSVEMLVFNYYKFNVISRSASHYHAWKRQQMKE